MRTLVAALLLLITPATASAQTPDRRGEVATPTPEYRGVSADAPIPTRLHFHNEGGSDDAGLCVICSVVFNGGMQGIGDLDRGKLSELWRAAKARPGGYSPGKLAELLKEVMPDAKWSSFETADPSFLAALVAKGIPVGVTQNTGALYQYQRIHHMVSLSHYEPQGWSCIVDNNDPGQFHWMPTTEFNRRFPDGGVGWAFWWEPSPGGPVAALLLATSAVVIVACVRRTVR
jgi:hypothetical protein